MFGYANSPAPSRPTTAADAFKRRRRKRQLGELPPAKRWRLEYLASRERLLEIALEVKRKRPKSAGPDGIKPFQLSKAEAAQMAGTLSAQILSGNYQPGRKRSAEIPKPAGGHRTLRIGNYADKVVARALYEAIVPLVDPLFVEGSHGFRPRRGVWTLLARLKLMVESEGLWTLVVKDVRKAFDSVRIEDVLAAHRELFAQTELAGCDDDVIEKLLGLVEAVLRGGQPKRSVGIATGCPYSPLALNVLLHLNHDLFLTGEPTKPLFLHCRDSFRYADNIVAAARSVHEGEQVIESIARNLLGCRLALKEDGGVFALGGTGGPDLLGFTPIRRREELEFELHPSALQRLEDRLLRAYDEPNPTRAAKQAILGWAASIGPALENGRALLPSVAGVLIRCGFREGPSRDDLEERLVSSHRRWLKLLQATRGQLGTGLGPGYV